MSAVPRPVDDDPEPVIVAVGNLDWAHRVRLADIVLADADQVDDAVRMCDELFDRYPGLSLVALCLPGGVVVIGRRCGPLLVLSSVTVEAAARAIYFCG